ncbi:hypothetical protein DV515_00019428, partial [Chloebia gouldiae]
EPGKIWGRFGTKPGEFGAKPAKVWGWRSGRDPAGVRGAPPAPRGVPAPPLPRLRLRFWELRNGLVGPPETRAGAGMARGYQQRWFQHQIRAVGAGSIHDLQGCRAGLGDAGHEQPPGRGFRRLFLCQIC